MADNDDVPFNRDFPLKPGVSDEVRPGVRRILCNNPSPFTFTGTVSYIVGSGKVAIIDPGGCLSDGDRLRAAVRTVSDLPIRYVIMTHAHPDHIFGAGAFADSLTRTPHRTAAPTACAVRCGQAKHGMPASCSRPVWASAERGATQQT